MNDEILFAQLSAINEKVSRTLTLAECLQGQIERHTEVLDGNGKDGLVVKVDRLEQRSKRFTWAIGLAGSAFIGTILDFFHRLIWGRI